MLQSVTVSQWVGGQESPTNSAIIGALKDLVARLEEGQLIHWSVRDLVTFWTMHSVHVLVRQARQGIPEAQHLLACSLIQLLYEEAV